ncbi:MAG: hypothetical protein JW816_03160, partial [Candidatus Buchananbacteria bacterium]|nr:hypothetical protein [Candidatus Buchananbacteria bacterium]
IIHWIKSNNSRPTTLERNITMQFFFVWHLHGSKGSTLNATSALSDDSVLKIPAHIKETEKEMTGYTPKEWKKDEQENGENEKVVRVVLHQILTI